MTTHNEYDGFSPGLQRRSTRQTKGGIAIVISLLFYLVTRNGVRIMQTTLNHRTSGQHDPKLNNKTRKQSTTPIVINGCSVTFSPSINKTDEPLKAVKEILLSAYRTRMASC